MKNTAIFTNGLSALAAALALMATCPAGHAQEPTAAQTSAIRANCRSDFMANCSGVQPGGKDALECLKRNLGKLSGGCQAAVSAISPPPAAAPPAAAAVPVSAPPASTASAPAAPAMSSPPAARPAPLPKTVVRAAAPPAAPAPVAAAPAMPAVPPLVLRPMLPQRRIVIMAICRADAERLCSGLPPIGPAVLDCLAVKAGSLSPTCYEALARVSEK